MNRLSIKARVTAWFAVVMFVIATCVFFAMTMHRSNQVKTNAARKLSNEVEGFSAFVQQEKNALRIGMEIPQYGKKPGDGENRNAPPMMPKPDQRIPERPRTYAGGVHIAVYDETYTEKMGMIPFNLENIDFSDGVLRTITADGEKYMVLDRKITAADGSILWVKGITNITGAQNAATSTLIADYLLICILIVVAAVGGYFIVGRALLPIAKMRETASEIADSNDLSRRINLGEGKDEVYRLASVFDEMLGKIQHTFEQEKQFTSDASHELRTPVAVVLSECEYALDCAKTEEEFTESLTVIKRQGDKMAKLISELLSISRMDKENFELNMEQVDLSDLLDVVCEEQKDIHEGNVVLHKNIEEEIVVRADSSLMTRLLINLISNAYQYSKEEGNIYVALKKAEKNVELTVADTGIGISEKDLPNIWERFYRADKARSRENGSMGLGLSMVKQIATLHNGTVSVTSTEGKGSTFTFTMPL